jgi:hypothetical protein
LAFVARDICVLRYDNEAGKGDHVHIGNRERAFHFDRHYVANVPSTVIPAKAGTQAAWVPAFAGMTVLGAFAT